MECARGSLNQVPPHATFSGDVRLTPFYDIKDLKAKVERSVWVVLYDVFVCLYVSVCAWYHLPLSLTPRTPPTPTPNSYIADLNANITSLPSLGPYSKYEVPEENVRGRLEFAWIGEVCYVHVFTFVYG